MRGLVINADSGPMPGTDGSKTRQVDDPAVVPRLVTVRVTASPGGAETTFPTAPLNGPIPAMATRPRTARKMTAPTLARRTVPWACEAAGCLSPSGLQFSHIDVPSGTVAPQRTHDWVSSAGGDEGVTGAWCHGRREGSFPAYQR